MRKRLSNNREKKAENGEQVTHKLFFKSYFYHMAFEGERSIEQCRYSSRFAQALSEEAANLP